MWWLDRLRGGDLGTWGEALAARELRKRGYTIVERRWRCRLGEIDLVAREGTTLVVVEVKTRASRELGSPADAVDWKKQRKLVELARAYVRIRHLGDVNVRFDVVGVTMPRDGRPKIELIRSAFEA